MEPHRAHGHYQAERSVPIIHAMNASSGSPVGTTCPAPSQTAYLTWGKPSSPAAASASPRWPAAVLRVWPRLPRAGLRAVGHRRRGGLRRRGPGPDRTLAGRPRAAGPQARRRSRHRFGVLADTDGCAAATVYAPVTDLALPGSAMTRYLRQIAADVTLLQSRSWLERIRRPGSAATPHLTPSAGTGVEQVPADPWAGQVAGRRRES